MAITFALNEVCLNAPFQYFGSLVVRIMCKICVTPIFPFALSNSSTTKPMPEPAH